MALAPTPLSARRPGAGLGITPAAAPRRWRAAWGLLAAAGVLWLHLVLLQGLAPAARPTGQGPGETNRHAAPLQVRALPLPPAVVPALAPPAWPLRTLPRPPAVPAWQVPAPANPAWQAPAPANPALPAPAEALPAPALAGLAQAPEALDAAEAATEDGGPGAPPPVYATRLPQPAVLRYALSYNGQAGEALLTWQHDGQHYRLSLEGAGAVRPLVVQASQGAVDAAGLAPERFVDRRRGGRSQAANFQRERGRIGYSGPATEHPAWPGAQDRLSWLAQLAAIRAAGQVGPEIRLFVADARGHAGLWLLQRQADEHLAGPDGERPVEVWRREPPRPEGLRVEAWLDPARGHWPVQLRFTAQRSGDVFALRLLDGPLVPP